MASCQSKHVASCVPPTPAHTFMNLISEVPYMTPDPNYTASVSNASIATHLLTRYFISYSDGEHERGGVSDKLLWQHMMEDLQGDTVEFAYNPLDVLQCK